MSPLRLTLLAATLAAVVLTQCPGLNPPEYWRRFPNSQMCYGLYPRHAQTYRGARSSCKTHKNGGLAVISDASINDFLKVVVPANKVAYFGLNKKNGGNKWYHPDDVTQQTYFNWLHALRSKKKRRLVATLDENGYWHRSKPGKRNIFFCQAQV